MKMSQSWRSCWQHFRRSLFCRNRRPWLSPLWAGSTAATTTTVAFCIPFVGNWFDSQKLKETPIYVWGSNEYGLVLPDSAGSPSHVKFPTRLDLPSPITSISAATTHAAAIDTEGNLYQWGEGAVSGPPACTLKGKSLDQVVCTEDSVIAFSRSSQNVYVINVSDVYASAEGAEGETCLGHWYYRVTGVNQLLYRGEAVSKIAAGHDHFVLLGDQGTILTAPLNNRGNVFGQLGTGASRETKKAEDYQYQPTQRPSFDTFMSVFWGGRRGGSSNSDPNNESTVEVSCVPHPQLYQQFPVRRVDGIPPSAPPVDVACGDHHTLVLLSNGRVYGFGSNECLQLALGPFERTRLIVPVPQEIPTLSEVTGIAAGGATSYFICHDHHQQQQQLSQMPQGAEGSTLVMAAGAGLYGQLGNGTWTHAQGTPVVIGRLSGQSWYDEDKQRIAPIKCQYITAGQNHVAAVMETFRRPESLPQQQQPEQEQRPGQLPGQDVYVWGCNKDYQLGLGGKHHNVSRPTTIIPFTLIASASIDAPRLAERMSELIPQSDTAAAKGGDAGGIDDDSTSVGLDLARQRVLRMTGAAGVNAEGTLSFAGGQFQLLSRDADKASQRIYAGPTVTIIY